MYDVKTLVMVKRIPEIPDNGSWLYLRKKHILFSLFTTNSREEDSTFHTLKIAKFLPYKIKFLGIKNIE